MFYCVIPIFCIAFALKSNPMQYITVSFASLENIINSSFHPHPNELMDLNHGRSVGILDVLCFPNNSCNDHCFFSSSSNIQILMVPIILNEINMIGLWKKNLNFKKSNITFFSKQHLGYQWII